MSSIRLQVLGEGMLGATLRAHGAPFGRVELVEGEGDAVLIEPPLGPDAVSEALRRGAVVLCPPALAQTVAADGKLIVGGGIAFSEAGRRALDAKSAPDFGAVRSLYLAVRQRRGPGDVLEELLPEALDFLLAAMPGGFTSLRVNAGALFGEDRDTAVILLRHQAGAFVTMELSRCLPQTLATEIEIDIVGAQQSVRVTPGSSAVRVFRDTSVAAHLWLNPPVSAMLHRIEEVVDGAAPDERERVRRAAELAARIRAAC